MQRYIYPILLLVVLTLPLLRLAVVSTSPAHSGNAERLVIITPHNQDIQKEFDRAFSDWHQKKYGTPVDLDFRVPGGTNDMVRQLKSFYDSHRDKKSRKLPAEMDVDIHMAFGGGDFTFETELKPEGILQPMRLDPRVLKAAFPEPALAGVRLYDATTDAAGNPAPQWVGVCLSAFGIVYNPDLYRALGLPEPQTWADLADPRLNGFLALADPVFSGSASVAYHMVVQRAMADAEEKLFLTNPELRQADRATRERDPRYRAAIAAGWKRGMGLLVRIVANARYFSDSAPLVPTDVGNGQAAAGMAIDFYGRVFQEMLGPSRCKVVLPRAATAITPDPIAILHGVSGRKLELARHFVEFLLSPEGQRLWILKVGAPGGPVERGLRRPPIRRDVYADRTGWADDVDPFATAGGFNQRAEWGALFSDTRMIWACAWIDSRDALKDAWDRILRVPDPARRSALIDELANLPIELSDVEELAARRKELKKRGNIDEWRTIQRIEWGKRFRAHYARVASGLP